MSVVRTRDLRKRGISDKKQHRKCRSYAKQFIKGNKLFAVNNYSFHLGLNDKFTLQSISL